MPSKDEDRRAQASGEEAGTLRGGCRCGAVRYRISHSELPRIYCCHCLLCQSSSGSAFSEQAIVPTSSLEAFGPILDYRFVQLSGGEGHHRLCAQCYTRLWSTNDVYPGFAFVRAGTLERSSELVAAAHMWAKRKQPWITIAPDVPQWPESPPPGELVKALGSFEISPRKPSSSNRSIERPHEPTMQRPPARR